MVPGGTTDIVLYHHESDKTWCKQLAERIREQPKGNRHFATQLAAWNFSNSADMVSEAEKWLRTSRFFCLVISKPMLRENWPALEKLELVGNHLGAEGIAALGARTGLPMLRELSLAANGLPDIEQEVKVSDMTAEDREQWQSDNKGAKPPTQDYTDRRAVSSWEIAERFFPGQSIKIN